ncbi:hypothetical protein E3A20_04790 [Planctomyces bekefii]|uniref:AMP-dependent synthetase/ligase domain-containing protein n=1 Tax=Planctomyces bekefii TaxID=1653850 RepID=A0A5C6M9X7_9PLAN|nr:hypothetical protein E3A20_04790 [Planctomyces bekefii]
MHPEVWHKAQLLAQIEAPSIGYGCSEASPGIAHLPPGIAPIRAGDIGRLLPSVKLSLDPEGGYRFSGPNLCLATIDGLKVEYPTSHYVADHIHRDADGHLFFQGRTDIVLNRGGEKYPLDRMEILVKERVGLDVICVDVPDDRLGSELGIVVKDIPENRRQNPLETSAQDQQWPDLASLFALLKAEFGRSFETAHIRRSAKLPVNAQGKPDRQEARSLFVSSATASDALDFRLAHDGDAGSRS